MRPEQAGDAGAVGITAHTPCRGRSQRGYGRVGNHSACRRQRHERCTTCGAPKNERTKRPDMVRRERQNRDQKAQAPSPPDLTVRGLATRALTEWMSCASTLSSGEWTLREARLPVME
jgi:hypothetical protein